MFVLKKFNLAQHQPDLALHHIFFGFEDGCPVFFDFKDIYLIRFKDFHFRAVEGFALTDHDFGNLLPSLSLPFRFL